FSEVALNIVMWVGTITAVYAALCAFVQSDIKRILAYSTLSQLGYMVAAFGLGAAIMPEAKTGYADHGPLFSYGVIAAMFHLTTHAFFKALMFLGSGSVIHACHHEQNIFRMGGLWPKMAITGTTFFIGVLAIAGFPFLSGFFSKDSILYLAQAYNQPVYWILTATALLTATYMFRLFVIAFMGKANSDHADHAAESPILMTLPLIVLALLAIGGGFFQLYAGPLTPIGDFIHAHYHGEGKLVQILSGVFAVAGFGIAFLLYRPGAADDFLEQKVPLAFAGLTRLRDMFDIAYDNYVEHVQNKVAAALHWIDRVMLGVVIVRGTAAVTGLVGMLAKALHVGNVGSYVYWFAVGVVIFGAYLITAF
ncbi:MAG: proton-conducting transporter membrane subunit, partial [Verrucomicrobiota bacterium]